MEFPETIEPKSQPVWATHIPGRSPEFKVHKTVGQAHNALSQRGFHEHYALYHLIDGVWNKTFEYHPPEVCECGRRYAESAQPYRSVYNRDPDAKHRWDSLPICLACYEVKRLRIREEYERQRELETLKKLKEKYE